MGKIDTSEWKEFRVGELFEKLNLKFLPNRVFDKASDMQFIGCAIERVTIDKYAFSEMCTGTKLLKDVILLPKDKTGQPDWRYMEEYMRKVEERVKATMGKYEMTVNEVAL